MAQVVDVGALEENDGGDGGEPGGPHGGAVGFRGSGRIGAEPVVREEGAREGSRWRTGRPGLEEGFQMPTDPVADVIPVCGSMGPCRAGPGRARCPPRTAPRTAPPYVRLTDQHTSYCGNHFSLAPLYSPPAPLSPPVCLGLLFTTPPGDV